MKRIGTFTVDELGRVSISNELRSILNWKTGEKLFVYHVPGNCSAISCTFAYANVASQLSEKKRRSRFLV